MSNNRSGMLKDYGLDLNDLEFHRHNVDIQYEVNQRILERELSKNNPEDYGEILKIWCEVILECKRNI